MASEEMIIRRIHPQIYGMDMKIYGIDMIKLDLRKKTQFPKECHQDQQIHPCGSIEFCPEDPEKCVFFRGGLR